MCEDKKTLHQCLKALQKIPQNLNDLYKTIIQSLKRRDEAQSLKVFQWIFFAHQSLFIAECKFSISIISEVQEIVKVYQDQHADEETASKSIRRPC